MTRRVELSHAIEDGMVTYRGLPAPLVCDWMSHAGSAGRYAPGTEFHIGRLEMVANTGTYIDAPFHRYRDGIDIAGLPLERVADLPGIVVHARSPGGRAIGADAFAGLTLAGRAVLVHTGWSAHWRTDAYFEGHPYLTADAATLLRDAGAVLVGIDSLNVDSTDEGTRPVHTTLLGAGIPIVEHLCGLDALPDAGFRFFAPPVRVAGLGSFPVRAFALIDG